MSVTEAERKQRHPAVVVAAIAVALMMPVAVFAPLGEAPLCACAGVAFLIRLLSEMSPAVLARRLRQDPLVLLFAALLFFAALSCSWSPGGLQSLRPMLEVAGMTLAGIVSLAAAQSLNASERGLILTALIAGLVVGGGLMAFELGFDGPISRVLRRNDLHHFYTPARFKRGMTVLAILIWPAAYYFRARRGVLAGAAVIACASAVILISTSRTSILGLVVALAIGALSFLRFRALFKTVLWLAVAGILLAPAAAGTLWGYLQAKGIFTTPLEKYELGRLGIWDYATELFLRSPIVGWGMDASRYLPPDPLNPRYRHLELHPHNATLQIALELGIPGLIIVFWGLFIVMRRALNFRGARKASAVTMLVSILLVCSLGYGVWQVWWQAAAWLAVTLLVIAWRDGDETAKTHVS